MNDRQHIDRLRAELAKLGVSVPAKAPRSDKAYLEELEARLTHERLKKARNLTPFQKRLKKIWENFVADALNFLLFAVLLVGCHFLVDWLFPEEVVFLGRIQVRYCLHLVDIGVIGKFIWNILKGEE